MMLLKLAKELRRRGFSQVVVSLMDGGALGPAIEKLGIPVESLGMKRGVPSWQSFRTLRSLIDRFRPDLIQGWMYHGNLAASISARRRMPVVWGVRQSLYALNREKWMTRVVITSGRVLAGFCDRIVYNSEVSAAQHAQRGFPASKGVVIGNGFELESYRPSAAARSEVRAMLGISESKVVLGNVARYHPMKNHLGLVDAFAGLSQAEPGCDLVMAGEGIDRDNHELVRRIQEQGLTDRVHLFGLCKDVAALMNGFDLYVSASSWGEGFPNVLGEAMACGIPCLATDVGDSAAIIGDTGWVVSGTDSRAIARMLNQAIAMDAHERSVLGERARERIQAHFSMKQIGETYERLYNEVLASRAAREINNVV